jgi:hypothetical protein
MCASFVFTAPASFPAPPPQIDSVLAFIPSKACGTARLGYFFVSHFGTLATTEDSFTNPYKG